MRKGDWMLDVLVPVIIIAYCLVVVYLLWSSSKKDKTALSLNFATIATLFWTASILATVIDTSQARVVFWSRLSFFFPILIAFSLSSFNSHFISEESKKKIYGPVTN